MTVPAPARDRFRWTILAADQCLSYHRRVGPVWHQHAGAILQRRARSLARTSRFVLLGFLSGDDRGVLRHRLARRPFRCAQDDVARTLPIRDLHRRRGTVAVVLDCLHQFLSRRLRLQLSQSRFDHRRDGLVSARRARHRDGYQTNRSSGRRSGRGGFSAFARARDRLARRAGRARDRQFSFWIYLRFAMARPER